MANENDDLLDPAEIEALLNSAGGAASREAGAAPAPGEQGQTAGGPGSGLPLAQDDIDGLLKQHARTAQPGSPEALLDRAAADLAAAVAPDLRSPGGSPSGAARPFSFEPFDQVSTGNVPSELSNLKDVELDLRIELGRTELLIDEVLKLREGSVVALDKLAGDPVDILANGRLIARGEVLVLNDNFCVRIAEILAPAIE